VFTFYQILKTELLFQLKLSELKDRVYKIGGPQLPDSCMPLGSKSENNQVSLKNYYKGKRGCFINAFTTVIISIG
jgi:hypothetical protein